MYSYIKKYVPEGTYEKCTTNRKITRKLNVETCIVVYILFISFLVYQRLSWNNYKSKYIL